MAKKIKVTPNVQKCLEILGEIVKDMPSGDLKTKAEGAVDYLDRTFKGEPQPAKGESCPEGALLIKT
jgi:hypothetical protein